MRLVRRPRDLDCIEFVELVTDFLEGALEPEEARVFERHLSICDGCRRYLDQMRETMRLTGRLEAGDVPVEGVDALLEAFRAYQVERASE